MNWILIFITNKKLFSTVVSLQSDLRISTAGKLLGIARCEHFER